MRMANATYEVDQATTRNAANNWGTALVDAAWAAGPPLLFALRLWASVCLALHVAFWLQLDNAFWAGTSAALVCQPQLGASLRKAWFRMVGTIVGAVMIVVLNACFPQDRAAFLTLLALGLAICAFAATLMRNFASYSAALAGYTAAIIAADTLGATGGPRTGRSSCWRSPAPARSASGSCAQASFSPGPTSAARSAGWPRCSPLWRPRLQAGLPACWRWPDHKRRTRALSDANSLGA